jgi:hypothetical protein
VKNLYLSISADFCTGAAAYLLAPAISNVSDDRESERNVRTNGNRQVTDR